MRPDGLDPIIIREALNQWLVRDNKTPIALVYGCGPEGQHTPPQEAFDVAAMSAVKRALYDIVENPDSDVLEIFLAGARALRMTKPKNWSPFWTTRALSKAYWSGDAPDYVYELNGAGR